MFLAYPHRNFLPILEKTTVRLIFDIRKFPHEKFLTVKLKADTITLSMGWYIFSWFLGSELAF